MLRQVGKQQGTGTSDTLNHLGSRRAHDVGVRQSLQRIEDTGPACVTGWKTALFTAGCLTPKRTISLASCCSRPVSRDERH